MVFGQMNPPDFFTRVVSMSITASPVPLAVSNPSGVPAPAVYAQLPYVGVLVVKENPFIVIVPLVEPAIDLISSSPPSKVTLAKVQLFQEKSLAATESRTASPEPPSLIIGAFRVPSVHVLVSIAVFQVAEVLAVTLNSSWVAFAHFDVHGFVEVVQR